MSTRPPVSRKGVNNWIETKYWRSSKCRCIWRSHEFKTARSEMGKQSSAYKRSTSEMLRIDNRLCRLREGRRSSGNAGVTVCTEDILPNDLGTARHLAVK